MAENLFLRPAIRRRLARHSVIRKIDQTLRHRLQQVFEMRDGAGHLSTTLATPVLLALSAARMTSRCSPGASPESSSANFSAWESITPSTDSMGTQLLASSEYSQRRKAL